MPEFLFDHSKLNPQMARSSKPSEKSAAQDKDVLKVNTTKKKRTKVEKKEPRKARKIKDKPKKAFSKLIKDKPKKAFSKLKRAVQQKSTAKPASVLNLKANTEEYGCHKPMYKQ